VKIKVTDANKDYAMTIRFQWDAPIPMKSKTAFDLESALRN
jgi:hypothetical protein